MSQTEFAKLLDVSRVTVSELLLEKRALTADMAVRIATLLKTTPESWLRMQEALDLWRVTQDPAKFAAVKPLPSKRLAELAAA
jgi:addiction module HigA family antidote